MNNQHNYQEQNSAQGTTMSYAIHRTNMPCPNCMRKKLIQDSPATAYCDECGQQFHKDEKELQARYK